MRDVQLEREVPPGVVRANLAPSFACRISQGLVAAMGDVLHALLPSVCRICEGPVLGVRTVRICDACLRDAVPAREGGPACDRCGVALGLESARFAAGLGMTACMLCRLAPPAFERAVSAGDYSAELRAMLHQLKYENGRAIAQLALGRHLAAAIATLPLTGAEVLVVPVPLFAGRRRERGYNQAELLAAAAVTHLGRMRRDGLAGGWRLRLAPHLLERVKDTRAMHTLQPHLRRASLQDAFRARHKEEIAGRTVLLVDDIMTTGATARECARMLGRAGATRVWVATVARAQPGTTGRVGNGANSTSPWTQAAPAAPVPVIAPRAERQQRFS